MIGVVEYTLVRDRKNKEGLDGKRELKRLDIARDLLDISRISIQEQYRGE